MIDDYILLLLILSTYCVYFYFSEFLLTMLIQCSIMEGQISGGQPLHM